MSLEEAVPDDAAGDEVIGELLEVVSLEKSMVEMNSLVLDTKWLEDKSQLDGGIELENEP